MRPGRFALLLGIAWAGSLACRPHAVSASAGQAGTTELSWQALPKEHVPSSGSPPSLKADDGRIAKLRTMVVRATLTPPVAFTEFEMSFDEIPAGQEGATFSIDLPVEAALSRFAVYDEGNWHDAEPASAEKPPSVVGSVKPNFGERGSATQSFSARVLRHAGHAPRLLIAYASTLQVSEAPYAVRLAGLPRLDALDATVRVHEHTYRLKHTSFAPDRDLTISKDMIGAPTDFQALRVGKFAVARILPETTRSAELTFLVDTSLSQSVPLPQISDFLSSVSKTLAAEKNPPLLTVVSFDQEIRPIVVRAKAPISREQLAPLAALGRLGGTDLTYAISTLAAYGLPHRHVVMLSDFENSMQPVDRNPSRDSTPERFDSLVADAAREKALLEKYATPFGYRPTQPSILARLDDDPGRVARLLMQPTPGKSRVAVKGASWSFPPTDEHRGFVEFAPEIGEPIWVFAEYEDSKPLQVEVNDKPKPSVAPVDDRTLSALLKQVVGGSKLRQLLAAFPYGYTEPADAVQALSEIQRLSKEYGLISPLSSFVVRGGASGGKPRYLAGRVVDTKNTRMVMSTTMVPPEKPAPRPEKCPELVGHRGANSSDDGCPPLYVDFSEARVRILADVSFVAGSGEPVGKLSPHLDELAELLTLRPEVTKVSVRAANKAQAEGVVRYLVKRGIAADRLLAERLLEGDIAPRKPTPKCKTAGKQVLLEVRSMSLQHINQRAARKPVQAAAGPGPSRLASIGDSMRASRRSRDPKQEPFADALRSSEAWVSEEPKNPLAYVALGNVLDARRDDQGAARAYGSLFDLNTPGAGLDLAAAMRFERLKREGRLWELAMSTFRKRWEDSKISRGTKRDAEGSRASAYASMYASEIQLRRGPSRGGSSGGMIYEAFDESAIVSQIEAPVFAHIDLHADNKAFWTAEMLLGRSCRFPMQGAVLGAVLSWEDAESELEVDVTAVERGFTYDSVLVDRTPSATLKWLPLPEDDDDYPIRISVRAERLGRRGYAFGILRVLNYNGRGRVFIEQKPFVATLVGERIPVHEMSILQRPQ